MLKRFTKIGPVALLCVSAALVGTFAVHAAPSGNLEIKEVFVDFGVEAIVITGENFDAGNPEDLVVTLGALGDISDICAAGDPQTITCDFTQFVGGFLPDDGDYALTIDVAGGQTKPVTYDLTIGAVGPVGPQGPAGAVGQTTGFEFYSLVSAPVLLGSTPQTQSQGCNAGDRVTGGGHRIEDGNGLPSAEPVNITASVPFPAPSAFALGWAVTANTASAIQTWLRVIIVCADVNIGDPIPPFPT